MPQFFNPYEPPLTSPAGREDENGHRRPGVVSIWAGAFASIEAAEWYFGPANPEGDHAPPYGFIDDFALQPFALECLELNFEEETPRSISELLATASHSMSFHEAACLAAAERGVETAQGVALLFNYDYSACPVVLLKSDRLTWLGTFAYDDRADALRDRPEGKLALRVLAEQTGFSEVAILALDHAMQRLTPQSETAGGGDAPQPVSARELCAELLNCPGGAAFLNSCGLRTSEDVGTLVYRLVELEVIRTTEGDDPSDFVGLYSL